MAHYAFLDNNIVTEVIVGIDETELIEGLTPEVWYGNFRGQPCVRTSYNGRIRYNYAGIGPDLIDYICDNTPIKQGKFSPGVHIPIFPEEQFRKSPPNYSFLAAWNHELEIRNHNSSFSEVGGRWITHVPEVRILD